MTVCVGSARGYGLTPSAVPYNGWLDVSVIYRPELIQLFSGMWMLLQGRILNHKMVKPYRTRKVKVLRAQNASVSLDGRILDRHFPLEITIQPDLRANSGGIVEEYIQQHPTLAQLNPGAVSIVRFYTVTAPSGTYLFAPVLTTAIEKDISNGCQDALTAMIDIRTGVVLTDAVDQNNFIDYHTHPITGVPFPGLQLPFWEETIDMMRRAVPLASKISNIGWDVTMTADGPLIIEANTIPGFNTAQYRGYAWVTDGYGYQPLFDELNGRPFVNNDHYARVLLKLD